MILNNLRRKFNQFCYRNRDKGIPNLMLYICVGSAIVFLMSGITRSTVLYDLLCFNRSLILRGQVWRLFTYAITFNNGNIFYTAIGLLCYFSLGRAIEAQWGTLRFNLFSIICSFLFVTHVSVTGHCPNTIKKPHTEDPMCENIESSSLVAAGFGTLFSQVAGFHRAVPSTTLDKAYMQFGYILQIFAHLSSISPKKFTILLWTFSMGTGRIRENLLGVT